MLVTVDSQRYRITFKHRTQPREVTACEIYSGIAPLLLAIGIARRHHRDQPNREIGRKAALAKALVHMSFTKTQRRQVWLAYLYRDRQHGIGRILTGTADDQIPGPVVDAIRDRLTRKDPVLDACTTPELAERFQAFFSPCADDRLTHCSCRFVGDVGDTSLCPTHAPRDINRDAPGAQD